MQQAECGIGLNVGSPSPKKDMCQKKVFFNFIWIFEILA